MDTSSTSVERCHLPDERRGISLLKARVTRTLTSLTASLAILSALGGVRIVSPASARLISLTISLALFSTIEGSGRTESLAQGSGQVPREVGWRTRSAHTPLYVESDPVAQESAPHLYLGSITYRLKVAAKATSGGKEAFT